VNSNEGKTMKTLYLPLLLLMVVPVAAQMPADETTAMRSAAEKRFPRELPSAIPEARSYAWQATVPKTFKRSLKVSLAAELKLDPRLAVHDRGYVERHRPALEQLALGLNADPPRPQYPILAAGARATGDSLSPLEIVQLPLLSRTSDAKISLSGDPATVAARPYTAALVTASRGSAPPRLDIVIPDPFVIQREAVLPVFPPDADPPAISLGVPQRPMLPLEAPAAAK
jgi:hypothetical protein